MNAYVLLQPGSNTNPGSRYRVAPYRDWLNAVNNPPAVVDSGETFADAKAARTRLDELNTAAEA